MRRLLLTAAASLIALIGLSANQCTGEQQQSQPPQEQPEQQPPEQQPPPQQ